MQLASHLPDIQQLEPLPDIDFNIYAGNSLVGGLSWEDLEGTYAMKLFDKSGQKLDIDKIKASVQTLSVKKSEYRKAQQENSDDTNLKTLKNEINISETFINENINIGIKNPFHWFIEFNEIMMRGGFDVVIGNPPYVEYNKINKNNNIKPSDKYKIKKYATEECSNLYAFFIERNEHLIKMNSWTGMIIPVSAISTERMNILKNYFLINSISFFSSFSNRPAKLFDGVEQRLLIYFKNNQIIPKIYFIQVYIIIGMPKNEIFYLIILNMQN